MSVAHTYGPTCLLHSEPNTATRQESEALIGPPPTKAHFFYCSALPIDDPLSPTPTPTGPSVKAVKLPPRPYSIHDNKALENTWLRLQKDSLKASARRLSGTRVSSRDLDHGPSPGKRGQERKHGEERRIREEKAFSPEAGPGNVEAVSKGAPQIQPRKLLNDDPDRVPFDMTRPVGRDEIVSDEIESGLRPKRSQSPLRRKHKPVFLNSEEQAPSPQQLSQSSQKLHEIQAGSSPSDRDTSGTPFLRIASRLKVLRPRPRSRSPSRSPDTPTGIPQADGEEGEKPNHPRFSRSDFRSLRSEQSDSASDHQHSVREKGNARSRRDERSRSAQVPVGLSRLHVVEMPSLKMGPIYWDPVHDISSVVRGTWFYKDTMWPVESDVANQIEAGYEYIKPWTSIYMDELDICQEVGAEAELKLVHRLWPEEDTTRDSARPGTSKSHRSLQESPAEKQGRRLGPNNKLDIVPDVSVAANKAAGVLDGYDDPGRLFARCSMMYINEKEAQILRPNQLPSAARGRRPLANIRKGRPVGIPVIRGFDYRAWETLHPPTKGIVISSETNATIRTSNRASQTLPPCTACLSQEDMPKTTDLVLVIHGIGQKLSERVESYHFTHAINSFRRLVNVELEVDAVKPWLRASFGNIMVLPINWRSKINIDDGGPELDPNRKEQDPTKNQYSLKDITAESIPAVRNLISDVLLDIPYYLSRHKPKMIEAVTKEANRIYRLWCTNNPGFQETGRVHILAHSLGSVMTLDILSKQPTHVPRQFDLRSTEICTENFEFETNNLFCVGSPAGLFLFINHVPLLPRKGRNKPGTDGEDLGPEVAGEAGTYGCLAVDNLYNVMHHIDPIAYQLNACVDVNYAASLQRAFVPSTATTWAQYFGLSKKSAFGAPKPLTGLDGFPGRPMVKSMPSTVELETHDFTQEEIAERRMYLLNDNGQIDFMLHSGGGPLEIQYLNMLSAHSSYWTMQDFVRFMVVEIGRKPGKDETVSVLQARKKVRARK